MRLGSVPACLAFAALVAAPAVAVAAASAAPDNPIPVRRAAATATSAASTIAASVTVTWNPGIAPAHAKHPVTTSGTTLATRLLREIDGAPTSPFDTGEWSCPADSGVHATLVFRTNPSTPRVQIDFTGCTRVRQAHHLGRTVTMAIYRDLRSIAPKQFRHYLAE